MSDKHPIRMLLIEDSPYDAAIFRHAMEDSGLDFTLQHVVRAEEAEAMLDVIPAQYDIVISDYSLPGMTGLAFCRLLLDRYPTMPLILLTGTGSEDIAVAALKTGVSDYLVKDAGNSYLELLPLLIPNAIRQQRERRLRAEFEEELRRSEARYRAIVEDQTDLICRFLPHGTLTFVNEAFCRYFGGTRDGLLGQSWLGLACDARDERRLTALLDQAGADHPLLELEQCLRDGGRKRWQRWVVRAIFAPDGTLSEYQAVGQDITAQKEYELALRQKTLDLEARNEELDAFAHTVAHDIKNPVSVVIGYAETLLVDDLDVEPDLLREMVTMIGASARKAVDIVDELLLLASVRQEEVALRDTDMVDVVGNVAERMAHMLAEKQGTLRVEGTLPAAHTYGPWVEEVLTNYVSNAIKYGGTPPEVVLGARVVSGGRVAFWVRDNGAGLTPAEQARLFQKFTRMAPQQAAGHGLGLSIVRRIARRLDGRVYVESAPGSGSTFFLELPAARKASTPAGDAVLDFMAGMPALLPVAGD